MTNKFTPQEILESVLAIERHHRDPASYDYQGCDHAPPCTYCQFIRPWAALKMEELGIEREGDPHKKYLCNECAAWMWRDVRECSTRREVCSRCKMERMVSAEIR